MLPKLFPAKKYLLVVIIKLSCNHERGNTLTKKRKSKLNLFFINFFSLIKALKAGALFFAYKKSCKCPTATRRLISPVSAKNVQIPTKIPTHLNTRIPAHLNYLNTRLPELMN